MIFVACRNLKNVALLGLPYDASLQIKDSNVADWGDKASPFYRYVPKGARFKIGETNVLLTDLPKTDQDRIRHLSMKTGGAGGSDRPAAVGVTKESEKLVAQIDKEVAAFRKQETEQAAAAGKNVSLNDLIGKVLTQQQTIIDGLVAQKRQDK